MLLLVFELIYCIVIVGQVVVYYLKCSKCWIIGFVIDYCGLCIGVLLCSWQGDIEVLIYQYGQWVFDKFVVWCDCLVLSKFEVIDGMVIFVFGGLLIVVIILVSCVCWQFVGDMV